MANDHSPLSILTLDYVVWMDGLLDLSQSPQVLTYAVLLGSPSLSIRMAPLTTAPKVPIIRHLTERLGIPHTLEYLLTGFEMTAAEALDVQLLDGVMELSEFEEWIARVQANSLHSQQLASEMIRLQASASQTAAKAAERYAFAFVFALPDASQGIRAFLEKRKPVFCKL